MLPPAAWREIRQAVKSASAKRRQSGHRWGTLAYMVAEVFSGAEAITEQALGTDQDPILSSAFDFPLRWATVGVLAAEESGLTGRPASTINESWAYGAHSDIYPEHALLNMMTGNHDFVRFGDLLQRVSLAEPDEPGWWARHRLAFMVQAAYSGPVTRYYGEELGDEVPGFATKVTGDCASQGLCDDHVARSSAKIPDLTLPAAELSEDVHSLMQFHSRLMKERSIYSALARGSRQHLFSDDSVYIDLKKHLDQEIIFAMNTDSVTREVRISSELFDSRPEFAWDILGNNPTPLENGELVIRLEALSGRYILLAEQPAAAVPITAGINDAWYDPETDGQGLLITAFPVRGTVFLAWFTYDTERPPQDVAAILGEPGHRWMTAQGPISDSRAQLQITQTSGGVFDSALPAPTNQSDGWIEIEFRGCNSIRLAYRINSVERENFIDLQRVSPGNVPLCEALSAE